MTYLIVGLLAGVTSGIGLGGGIILIPALTLIYGLPQQQAQSINLLYFLPTALIAVWTHMKNGTIEKSIMPSIIIWGLLSSLAGAVIAMNTDPLLLKKIFGGFMLIMGLLEFFKKVPQKEQNATPQAER